MIAREFLILAIGIFVSGNLGVLMMCLMAIAKQADEQVSSVELAWLPVKD